MKSRRTILLSALALLLVGVGVGVALAQSQSPSPTTSGGQTTSPSKGAFLDDVAKRLGIQRTKLDAALKDQALANVKWAENNGFITKAEADELRQRIQSPGSGDMGRFGHHGGLGFGFGFGPGKPPLGDDHHGRHFDKDGGSLTAAANYLGISVDDLATALASKTLAQVAADHSKSLAGLGQALRASQKTRLDGEVTEGDITKAQEDALLQRFDGGVGDLVNGIPPGLTDLATRLGVDRSKLIAAIKGASIDQVDSALAQGLITKAQADAIKQRIQSSPGALPLRGFCGGPGLGLGHFGFGLGMGHFGFGFDHPGLGLDGPPGF